MRLRSFIQDTVIPAYMRLRSFIQEIGIPEYKAVIGYRGSRIIILSLLFFISLLVLGVANSSSNLLKKKLQGPFIQFIDIKKPTLLSDDFEEITSKKAEVLISDSSLGLSPQFQKGIRKRYSMKISGKSVKFPVDGMLITEDDLFYKEIQSMSGGGKSLLTKSTFSDDGFGLIITKQLFDDFGLIEDSWKKVAFVEVQIKNRYVKLPVAEVVEELRNNCQFAFSKNFLNCHANCPEVFHEKHYKGSSTYFLPEIKSIPLGLDPLFSLVEVPQQLSANCHVEGVMVESIDTNAVLNTYGAIKILDIRMISNKPDNFNRDYFTFHLKDLSKIEVFADRIKKDFGVIIEKSKIEEKKNIDFFDNITTLFYYTLTAFSIASIILFIINFLVSHLNSSKRSLGTLKAFGLSNNYIIGLYSSITLYLISISFLIAYISSELVGQIVSNQYLNFVGVENEGFTYDNLDIWKLILFMVIIPVVVILVRVFKYLHNVTPGDLIYERK